MIKVRMLKTLPGSPDGIRVFEYTEGEEYHPGSSPPMSKHLRDVLVPAGLAVDVVETEAKALVGPTENKALAPGGENKGARSRRKAGDT